MPKRAAVRDIAAELDDLRHQQCLECERLDLQVELGTLRLRVADLERWLLEGGRENKQLKREAAELQGADVDKLLTIKARHTREAIDEWEPRQSCANCQHARVRGQPDWPLARCAKGHGAEVDLYRLIRPQHAQGWRAVAKCEDYEEMG